jgi:glycosyltransferase involved in cell wall biosynthesis
VREVVENGVNGLLKDFFDVPALTAAMVRAVREPEVFAAVRQAARATVVPRYDSKRTGIPAWLKLIDEMVPSADRGGRIPSAKIRHRKK